MMNCAKIAFIEAYLRDEFSPAERAEFERHLAACPRCRQAVEREQRFDELLRGRPLLAAPATLRERVLKGLDSPKLLFSFSDRIWMIGLGLVLAAIGAIIGYAGREIVSGVYARILQWLALERVFESARSHLPTTGTDWLGQLTAANSLSLLNFFVAAVILCWGLWQMVKVLRR